MPETLPAPVIRLIERATEADATQRARAMTAARALAPLELSGDWQLAAAAVPLLAARAISEGNARLLLGPELYSLAAQAAALPNPRLAAREAMLAEDPEQGERLRRLFLGLIRDLRIVPLMLADVLSRLESLKSAPLDERAAAAHEVFVLHAPLANRLGIWQLKWPLEDWALRLSDPESYSSIARGLAERRGEREDRLAGVSAELAAALERASIQAVLNGRPKHICSIRRKMQHKGRSLEELYDLMGLRVIVQDIATCYAALGVVHERWHYLPQEFDDYIAAPKGNFYRSLHTAVLDDAGHAIEIQIRTEAMHQESELGIAAHWRYKEGGTRDVALEESIAWLRQLLATGEDAGGEGNFVHAVTSELTSARIYTLTPRGRIVDLPRHATPLDFAYAVHTGLGHRTTGARVNGRMVPLTHRLDTGDTVEILARAHPQPSRDWLRAEAGYVTTRRARNKLRIWFRDLDRAPGREREPAEKPPPAPPRRSRRKESGRRAVVSVMPELPAEPAHCCAPRPGDAIAAFVTRGRGIRMHRQDCPSYRRNAIRAPRQTLAAHWE
ncbi:MAG: TGS domain-containing protein [Gammaproteobacteria bacterium]|nr:TGS domain-containing protein [Gammaproteobacteria bacterium]